jgi:uncharacterized membrane protein (TIGR02234 family)
MRAERMKLPVILATIIGAGLALISCSQTWFGLTLESGVANDTPIEVAGSIASPALAALALAGLALVAALAIAGPGIRVVLGVLEVVLGGCVIAAAWISLADPVASVSAAVTDATGVSGAEPTAALVGSVAATAWPALALVGGALLVVAGVVVLVTGTRWPVGSRRYGGAHLADDAAPASAAGERATSDRAIDDWDELSRGDDPTDEPTDEPSHHPADDDGPAGPSR